MELPRDSPLAIPRIPDSVIEEINPDRIKSARVEVVRASVILLNSTGYGGILTREAYEAHKERRTVISVGERLSISCGIFN